MRFTEFLAALGPSSTFTYETARVLLDQDRATAQVTLSRWVSRGLLQRIQREFYVIGEKWRRTEVDFYNLACQLRTPCYLTSHWALNTYTMIPEAVWCVVAATTKQPGVIETPLGRIEYQHIKPELFWGFTKHEVKPGLPVYIAEPEKALLDLFWLSRKDWPKGLIEAELRLSIDGVKFSRRKFMAYARRFDSPRMLSIAERTLELFDAAPKITPIPLRGLNRRIATALEDSTPTQTQAVCRP